MIKKSKSAYSYYNSLSSLYDKLDKKDHKVLTKEEEYEMLKKIKENKNDKELVNKFVNHNIDLIVSIANKIKQSTPENEFDIMDLVNEGVIGIYKAIERFDINSGNKFSTYATYWIKSEISRAVIDKGKTIRKPVYFVELMRLIKELNSSFYAKNGVYPTTEDICKMLNEKGYNYSIEKLKNFLEIEYEVSSISTDLFITIDDEEDENCVISLVKDDRESNNPADNLYNRMIKDNIYQALDCLRPIEKEVIILKFGLKDGISYERKEISQMLNLPEIKIYYLEKNALKKLKANKIIERHKIYQEPKEKQFILWLNDGNSVETLKNKKFSDGTTYLKYYIENKELLKEKVQAILNEEEIYILEKYLLQSEDKEKIENKNKNKRIRTKRLN